MSVLSGQPMETHVQVSDAWLNEYAWDKNAVYECYNRDTPQESIAQKRVQRPRAITVDSNGSDGEATTAVVRGFLWGENTKDTDDYVLLLGEIYPIAFKRIYAQGTNARGIKIFG
jgi:hypothetical protein